MHKEIVYPVCVLITICIVQTMLAIDSCRQSIHIAGDVARVQFLELKLLQRPNSWTYLGQKSKSFPPC